MPRTIHACLLLPCLILAFLRSASPGLGRERLVVLTDISNEPDDEQSLVRLLVYANEFETEGSIAPS